MLIRILFLITEDLYEELELEADYVPPIPESPRPSRPALPQAPADDIIIDEDIYEDTDDFLPTTMQPPVHHSPQHTAAPSLPDRNPPKKSSPPPSLPPRSVPAPSPIPALPPRNPTSRPGASTPQDYEKTKAKKAAAPPPMAGEDEELYDDVVVPQDEIEETYDDVVVPQAEIEETYDDVVVPTGPQAEADEELYDDVVAMTTGLTGAEPEENYEDMAPGTLAEDYVTMEKGVAQPEAGEELYVDVDEPVAHSMKPDKPSKQASNSKTKKRGSDQRGSLSSTLGYKAPKKSKFDNKWVVIDGGNLVVYKSSGDKRSQEKIALGECKLELGSTEAGAGKFAFRVSKGDKVHHFSLRDNAELDQWVGVVKGLVKYAPVEVKAEEDDIYQAKEDHIAESDGELTFKKGTYIRLMSRLSPALWVGQIGNEDQVFEGKTGKFPASKVAIAEDLYI